MSMVRFASLCDRCGARSEEYTSWPSCRECLQHTCRECAQSGSIDDESGNCLCKQCALLVRVVPPPKGASVRVSGRAGTVLGHVEACERCEDLPDVPGMPGFAAAARATLLADGFTHAALISYSHNGRRVVFCAVLDAQGLWWDLQRNAIAVTDAEA